MLRHATLEWLFATYFSTGMAETFGQVAAELGRELTEPEVEPLNWALAQMGAQMPAAERQAAFEAAPGIIGSVLEWWNDFDLLLTPTLAEPPIPIGTLGPDPADPLAPLRRAEQFAPFTPFVNMTGQPAISLPLHTDENGLPIGVQLVAAPGREDLLLQVAAQLEAEMPGPTATRPPSTTSADVDPSQVGRVPHPVGGEPGPRQVASFALAARDRCRPNSLAARAAASPRGRTKKNSRARE